MFKPGIERGRALADISHSALCCHSNQTRASIANAPNSAQLGAFQMRLLAICQLVLHEYE